MQKQSSRVTHCTGIIRSLNNSWRIMLFSSKDINHLAPAVNMDKDFFSFN